MKLWPAFEQGNSIFFFQSLYMVTCALLSDMELVRSLCNTHFPNHFQKNFKSYLHLFLRFIFSSDICVYYNTNQRKETAEATGFGHFCCLLMLLAYAPRKFFNIHIPSSVGAR